MTDDNWISIIVGGIAGLGIFWAGWRYLLGRIVDTGSESQRRDDVLHSRVTGVERDYVRREDFVQHMDRWDKALEKMEASQARHNEVVMARFDRMDGRFDALLLAIKHSDDADKDRASRKQLDQ